MNFNDKDGLCTFLIEANEYSRCLWLKAVEPSMTTIGKKKSPSLGLRDALTRLYCTLTPYHIKKPISIKPQMGHTCESQGSES